MENNLIVLFEADGFIQQFQLLQQQMKEIQEVLRIQPAAVSPATSTPEDSHSSDSSRTMEEMDHLDPPGEDSSSMPTTRASQKVAEVSEHMEQHLVCSFASMDNEDCRKLADSFALPKVVVIGDHRG